jgi:hypothetical protein
VVDTNTHHEALGCIEAKIIDYEAFLLLVETIEI